MENGGALFAQDANPTFVNCSLLGNSAGGNGGALGTFGDALPSFNNCILWKNSSDPIFDNGGTTSINFSIVEGGFTGTSNIDDDPLFVDELGADGIVGTGDEDLALATGSPAIDAGDNTVVPMDVADIDGDNDIAELLPLDLIDNLRFADDPLTVDSGIGNGPIVDIGAIEFQNSTGVLLGDVNLDGNVNLLDVEPFVDRLLTGTFQAEADTNQDGAVNLLDVDPFIEILSN